MFVNITPFFNYKIFYKKDIETLECLISLSYIQKYFKL